MKVAIIEDSPVITFLVKTARAAGHEVLGVHIGKADPDAPDEVALGSSLIHTFSVDQAAGAVRAFNPDVVFIDHDLGLAEEGNIFALKLGFPPEKCVGISIASDQSSYCARKMLSNKMTFRKKPEVKSEFLGLITS